MGMNRNTGMWIILGTILLALVALVAHAYIFVPIYGHEAIYNFNTPPIAYYVFVSITNDAQGAGWLVNSSIDSISGQGNIINATLLIGGPTDTLTAAITSNPSGYTCSISPSQTPVTSGGNVTFTVTCQPSPPSGGGGGGNGGGGGGGGGSGGGGYPPCTVNPPSVSPSPSGAPTPSSSASVSSIPYNQTETVTFTYNAQESGDNYVFQYWSIGGSEYTSNVVTITETLTCTTPGGTLTGPSGTAYYQYQPPGTISIDPDTINLKQTSETYTFTWTSDWSGTGTFTYSFSGQVEISYPNTVSGAPTWNANVTLPGGTKAAYGGADLTIAGYPEPPNPHYHITCTVSGGGTVNGVSASGGSEQGTAQITCNLQSKNGGPS
jgi:hypothetical protein